MSLLSRIAILSRVTILFRAGGLALGFAAALAAAPGISAIVNAASYIPPSLPNSGVAQGALFSVFGSGLGPATAVQAQSYPLPTTQGIGGTTIQVTVNSTVENCIMFYSSATQLIAILPSPTPVGTGTLTVTYQGASGAAAIQVQASNFGAVTLNGAGYGPVVVTDQSYTPITLVHPAHPGDILTLWGTGMGPISGNETEPPTQAVNMANVTQVLIGNQIAAVSYSGRGGGSPGLDQIDFTVPAGVSGCKTSIAVTVSGVTGNVTTMAVAPVGQATCGDTYGLLTAQNVQTALTSGSVTLGGVQAYRVGDLADTFVGSIGPYPLNSLIRSLVGTIAPSVGSCSAYEVEGGSFVVNDPYTPSTYLGMGAQLTITGPAGSKTIGESAMGTFGDTLATPPSTWIAPGSYTLSNNSGAGGSNIGAFTWNLALPANVVPSNLPSTVDLSQNLTLTWTGGAAFPIVVIFGYAGVPLDASGSEISFSEFVCTANGSAGQFTIPSAMLNLIPPAGYGTTTTKGLNIQLAGVTLSTFTNLPGVAEAIFSVYESSGGIAKIQ
jgi:uncharacterized protein (TIGR03437 family)